MPKYALEIGGKTYDIESERPLSDSDLAAYARQIAAPQQTAPAAPPGQIPGAGPYRAPPAAEVPIGRQLLQGAQRNLQTIARVAQPSAEMLASAGGALRGAAALAPAGPVAAAAGGLAGGIAGFTGARAGAELLQGQRPDVLGATEEAATGEIIGRGLGSVVRAGARGLDLLRSIPERKAVGIAQQAAGPEAANIRAALQAAELGMTPAQATAGSPRQAWQALLAFEPTDFAADVARRQKALSQAQLGQLAGGTSATAARETAEAGRAELTARTMPMMQTELAAANEAQRVMNALVPRATQKQASMVSALQDAGRTGTEAAQRTEAAVQQLQRVAPGQIPAISARQAARTQAAAASQQQEASNLFADIARQRRAEQDFINRQIGSLESYGLRPLDVSPLVNSIDSALTTPGLRASNDVTRVMTLLKQDLADLAQKGGGTIDAHDLYTIRKEGIAQRVRDVVKQDDPKAGAKVTAAVLERLRPLIDDAIKKAGGTEWETYLKTYSKGMDVIARKQMAAQALAMFKGDPQDYVKLVRGDKEEAVEAIFGPGRYSIFKEMAAEMPTLDKIAKRVEMDKLAAEKAGGGAAELAQIMEANRAKLRLPNWFSPAITATNMRLADVEKRVNKKTIDMVRKAAESNQSMLDLLNGLPAAERQKLLNIVTSPSTWSAPARAVIAPAIGEISRQGANALAPLAEPTNALID
jgi:hypothetical protein